MNNKVDVVYVVASKLGSIGMGSTSYNAIKCIENSGLTYKAFSRGYDSDIDLNKKNLTNYGFLEYLSYPFRFLEKKMGLKINSFALVNYLFGKMVEWNLPKTKIYHTWIGISPDAIKKAKKNGSILVLEAANSHPRNVMNILNKEFKKYNENDFLIDSKEIKKQSDLIKEFDYIMCPSDFVYDSFLAAGFSKKQLIKLPYGVDVKRFSNQPKKIDDKFRVLFVGSVQLRKGIQYLLEAWNSLNLKNAELVIVGRVWPDAQNVVNKYKANESIKFVGFDSHPERYLSQSSVFVSPSLEEGSALTCYEAMASGLPVIATYNTGSVVRDGKDGFVIPVASVGALKNKIRYLYNNPKELAMMGRTARTNVKSFSWTRYGKSLVKKYEYILNCKRGTIYEKE
jgi:glycosyltransferase involved in cell wall biosynthesis